MGRNRVRGLLVLAWLLLALAAIVSASSLYQAVVRALGALCFTLLAFLSGYGLGKRDATRAWPTGG